MIHPLKITNTLSDETRFHIYELMLKHKKTFNVQDIADHFHIHPNVARLHLTKLSEINLITAEFVKTGKGGRPGRVYRTQEEGVQLSFPRRDHQLMLEWLIETIIELGEPAIEKGKEVAFKYGKQSITHMALNLQLLTLEERIEILQEQSALLGYIADVEKKQGFVEITFNIYNCPFQSMLKKYSETVCQLHESFLHGQVTALFGKLQFEQKMSMLHNCSNCQYSINNVNVSK